MKIITNMQTDTYVVLDSTGHVWEQGGYNSCKKLFDTIKNDIYKNDLPLVLLKAHYETRIYPLEISEEEY